MKPKHIADMMSCVEKRHMSHRTGSMLHHRFPNGFTDLFMDETDREVCTLTDRAFRSLCIGDDAVYNDEFSYGFSPFSCHKPLAGEPRKKTVKETKKHGQSRNDKHEKTMSQMSSFLKALSATEESYGGMFKKNGLTDSNGESWDKSALRSIQRELSEFSTDYHSNLSDGHNINHQRHPSVDGSTNKTGKDSGKNKSKNSKSNVKLKKLNIKNFFLHSEFSPFQSWKDLNHFSFSQEHIVTSILPEDPKWYDLPFYKELTEPPKKESPPQEEPEPCQEDEPAPPPPPPAVPKPPPPPVPPKVLPKPILTPAEKRCTSEGVDGTTAPWRRNRSRATSAVPVNQPTIPTQDSSMKQVDENLLLLKKVDENLTLLKKEVRSVEVKTVEEVNSLASTPFSICQLMTPIIPSRQPTDTSEILTVLSPSALDLQLLPQSEAKVTPEPPIKREGYKSLASSILFNLKDNRKRVKSRYSPRKFKTLEEPENGSPPSDHVRQAFSEGIASGMNTPAIVKDTETVCSPLSETNVQSVELAKQDGERPLSNDYLLSSLLLSKNDSEASPMSPLLHLRKNKSPLGKKQNYPSLNLYKKSSPVDSDMKYPHVPLSPVSTVRTESVKNYLSPPPLNKDLSPLIPSPCEGPTLQGKLVKRPPDVPEKPKRRDSMEPVSLKENNVSNQPISAANVIKAAREAINAAKNKALSVTDMISKPTDQTKEVRNRQEEKEEKCTDAAGNTTESVIPKNNPVVTPSSNDANSTDSKNSKKRKEPPPVPKRNFTKSDIQIPIDNPEKLLDDELDNSKSEIKSKNKESSQKQAKLKHIFAARQNNYIKNQRYTITVDDQELRSEESDLKVSASTQNDSESKEIRDSENIISDLNALKELERARLAERLYDTAKNKFGVVDIVEQTKARNDLISRELRNIKKGMMSMRGNTMAKRDLFAKKEKEQSKGEAFAKIDSNVIVNKALINDNYDKAKMALEEIICEREKRKTETSEQEVDDESFETRFQKQKGTIDTEVKEKLNGPSATDLKERLSELIDHNNIRQILSKTEPRLGETHRAGGRIPLPGMNTTSEELNALMKAKSDKIEKLISNYLNSDLKDDASQESEETVENVIDKKQDAPPVPPRSRKGSIRRDSISTDTSIKDMFEIGDFDKKSKNEETSKPEAHLDKANNVNLKSPNVICDLELLSSKLSALENRLHLTPDAMSTENKKNTISPITEVTPENKIQAKGTGKVKRRAPLRPDLLTTPVSNNVVLDQPDKTIKTNEDTKLESEFIVESPRNIISPLLLVNGVSVNQSPPDQSSLSSKSSYYTAESALHRNTETESNIYHSLENLIGEIEEVDEAVRYISPNARHDSERTEAEYYYFSDHESEPEPIKRLIKSPEKEVELLCKEEADKSIKESHGKENETSSAESSNPVSPTFAIPALFKVKDNTFSNKLKKITTPWSPRGSLAGIETLDLDKFNKNPEPLMEDSLPDNTTVSPEIVKVEEVPATPPPPLLVLPTSPTSEKLLVQQDECFLMVPQEDRYSGVSPLSEVVESTATSTGDTAEETGIMSGIEHELTIVPSERSGSTCSGNDSQTGLPKPPAVLPKSEKAVLKAMKLTTRRIKKEEAQKSSVQKSSSSSSKKERHSNRKSGERKHREKTSHHNAVEEKTANSSQKPLEKTDISQPTRRPSVDSESGERQGRSSDRQVRDRPEQRQFNSERVFSNVPVYKPRAGDRTLHRSLSTDRYMENKLERRLSADTTANDPRSQRIEKSIMEELQQRGRQKDKPSKDNPLRRSHSIDSQSTNVVHPANLSRQSSATGQLSRQSSIEHAIVTQSFPLTQRKLLQDPDSGHYFFVDMPVQVKTKTFFDPETGSYVQLPVQPPEGAVPQPSQMEVLSPPLVVYHSFVPVPLSPMAQTAPVQAPHIDHEEFDQRHLERVLTGHSYLEPVFGQHEHMLGEFLGTEELDCPS